MCVYFYIAIIDFVPNDIRPIDFTSIFSPKKFKENDKITCEYFFESYSLEPYNLECNVLLIYKNF